MLASVPHVMTIEDEQGASRGWDVAKSTVDASEHEHDRNSCPLLQKGSKVGLKFVWVPVFMRIFDVALKFKIKTPNKRTYGVRTQEQYTTNSKPYQLKT